MGDRLNRRVVILCKTEGTYGVDSSPAATDAILIEDPVLRPIGEKLERRALRDTLSLRQHIIGIKHVELTFTTELKGQGAGATPPETDPLWLASSMVKAIDASNNTVTYTPDSSAVPSSCTIYVNMDGIQHKMLGCRTSWEIDMQAGQYGKINWTVWGLYVSPTDVVLPSPSGLDATIPPMIKAASFAMGGFSAVAQQFQINYNNTLVLAPSLNASEAVKSIRISERSPNGSFNPEAELEADEVFWADWEAATKHSFSITIGSSAGNQVVITGYAVYDAVEYGDRDGIMIYDIPFSMPSNTDAGDDEVQIVFQ